MITRMILENQFVLEIANTSFHKLARRKIVSKRHILTVLSSHFIKALIIFRCIYYYCAKLRLKMFFDLLRIKHTDFFILVYFVCHTPQFMMLVFAFQSEVWIVQNFNFTVFEDFCLSLSWKYRFSQNVNHAKVQSKTNKYWRISRRSDEMKTV